MTVESNYVIGIATLSDWLKRFAPVFQPMLMIGRSNCFGLGFSKTATPCNYNLASFAIFPTRSCNRIPR